MNSAFQAGQLSLIEYLLEVRYFYDARTRSLEAERALQQLIAELQRYQV